MAKFHFFKKKAKEKETQDLFKDLFVSVLLKQETKDAFIALFTNVFQSEEAQLITAQFFNDLMAKESFTKRTDALSSDTVQWYVIKQTNKQRIN